MNELDRLLSLAAREPAYGPAFFRALLDHEVYVLMPETRTAPEAKVHFVMWTGPDGVQVIPFFSNRARARRALTATTVAIRLNGRVFLNAVLGATVVCNPNEDPTCRIAPEEVAALLETGAVSDPAQELLADDTKFRVWPPGIVPVELTSSLCLYLAGYRAVCEGFLVRVEREDRPNEEAWWVVLYLDREENTERLARELAAIMLELQPSENVDVCFMTNIDSDIYAGVREAAAPFYSRELGERIVEPTSAALQ